MPMYSEPRAGDLRISSILLQLRRRAPWGAMIAPLIILLPACRFDTGGVGGRQLTDARPDDRTAPRDQIGDQISGEKSETDERVPPIADSAPDSLICSGRSCSDDQLYCTTSGGEALLERNCPLGCNATADGCAIFAPSNFPADQLAQATGDWIIAAADSILIEGTLDCAGQGSDPGPGGTAGAAAETAGGGSGDVIPLAYAGDGGDGSGGDSADGEPGEAQDPRGGGGGSAGRIAVRSRDGTVEGNGALSPSEPPALHLEKVTPL